MDRRTLRVASELVALVAAWEGEVIPVSGAAPPPDVPIVDGYEEDVSPIHFANWDAQRERWQQDDTLLAVVVQETNERLPVGGVPLSVSLSGVGTLTVTLSLSAYIPEEQVISWQLPPPPALTLVESVIHDDNHAIPVDGFIPADEPFDEPLVLERVSPEAPVFELAGAANDAIPVGPVPLSVSLSGAGTLTVTFAVGAAIPDIDPLPELGYVTSDLNALVVANDNEAIPVDGTVVAAGDSVLDDDVLWSLFPPFVGETPLVDHDLPVGSFPLSVTLTGVGTVTVTFAVGAAIPDIDPLPALDYPAYDSGPLRQDDNEATPVDGTVAAPGDEPPYDDPPLDLAYTTSESPWSVVYDDAHSIPVSGTAAVVSIKDLAGGELASGIETPNIVGAAASIDTIFPRAGGSQGCYRFNCVGTAAEVNLAQYNINGTHTGTNGKLGGGIGYFRFEANPAANAVIFQVEANPNATPSAVARQFRASLTTAGRVRLEDKDGTQIGSDSAILATGEYHKLEWKCADLDLDGAVQIELKVDGTVVATTTTAPENLTVAGIGTIWHGCLTNTTLDIRWDDMGWHDGHAYFAGELTVNARYPGGAGTYAEWNQGTGTTFAETDDWVSGGADDADTTYIKNNGANSRQLHTLAGPSTIGDTVYGIKNLVRARMEAGTTAYGFERSGATEVQGDSSPGSNYLITLNSIGTSYVTRRRPQSVDPNGGGAFTAASVEALQVGYRTTAGGTTNVRITAYGILVGHTGAQPEPPETESVLFVEDPWLPKSVDFGVVSQDNDAIAPAVSIAEPIIVAGTVTPSGDLTMVIYTAPGGSVGPSGEVDLVIRRRRPIFARATIDPNTPPGRAASQTDLPAGRASVGGATESSATVEDSTPHSRATSSHTAPAPLPKIGHGEGE